VRIHAFEISFGGNAKKFKPRFSFLVKMYFYY